MQICYCLWEQPYTVQLHWTEVNINKRWGAVALVRVMERLVPQNVSNNTFKNCIDAHWEGNPPDLQVNW